MRPETVLGWHRASTWPAAISAHAVSGGLAFAARLHDRVAEDAHHAVHDGVIDMPTRGAGGAALKSKLFGTSVTWEYEVGVQNSLKTLAASGPESSLRSLFKIHSGSA